MVATSSGFGSIVPKDVIDIKNWEGEIMKQIDQLGSDCNWILELDINSSWNGLQSDEYLTFEFINENTISISIKSCETKELIMQLIWGERPNQANELLKLIIDAAAVERNIILQRSVDEFQNLLVKKSLPRENIIPARENFINKILELLRNLDYVDYLLISNRKQIQNRILESIAEWFNYNSITKEYRLVELFVLIERINKINYKLSKVINDKVDESELEAKFKVELCNSIRMNKLNKLKSTLINNNLIKIERFKNPNQNYLFHCLNKYYNSRNSKLTNNVNSINDNDGISRCVFEMLMSVQEGCEGLINIDSGANRLILKLAEWFDVLDKNKTSNLTTASKAGGLAVGGVGTFGNFNNVKWSSDVSVDLISVAKLAELGFYCILGKSAEEPVLICDQVTHRVIKRGVIINDLFWITVEDLFDLAFRSGRTVDEHHRYVNMSNTAEFFCDVTAEKKSYVIK